MDDLTDVSILKPLECRNRKELYALAKVGGACRRDGTTSCRDDDQGSCTSSASSRFVMRAGLAEALPVATEEDNLQQEFRDAVASRLEAWRRERALAVDLHPASTAARDATKEPLTLKNPVGSQTNYEIRASQPLLHRTVQATLDRKLRPELRRSKHYPRPRQNAQAAGDVGNGRSDLESWKLKIGVLGMLEGCRISCPSDNDEGDYQ